MGDLDSSGDDALADGGRRRLLRGLAVLPLAVLPFAPAAAQPQNPESVAIPAPEDSEIKGVLALPEAERAPALLLIPEWWGLTDTMRDAAADFVRLGFVTFAADPFDAPPLSDAQAAMRRVEALDRDTAIARLAAAVDWLAMHGRGNGRVGVIGWGFGGGLALDVSLATPVDATVIYYGDVNRPAVQLSRLSGAVLAHFGLRDEAIPAPVIERFEAAMREAGKERAMAIYRYDAGHAFASPGDARYDADNARLARDRTLEFLRARLG